MVGIVNVLERLRNTLQGELNYFVTVSLKINEILQTRILMVHM